MTARASTGCIEHVLDARGALAERSDDDLSSLLREASAEVNRAEAHRLAVAAEWDRRQAWANDGASLQPLVSRATAAW